MRGWRRTRITRTAGSPVLRAVQVMPHLGPSSGPPASPDTFPGPRCVRSPAPAGQSGRALVSGSGPRDVSRQGAGDLPVVHRH
ncbi:hypothetical protein Franean1_3300 [Parafrankia sp. EAN1pec]|nr:hypothetical protein Franean1_3300 [Frankia sp. EAN1pec]